MAKYGKAQLIAFNIKPSYKIDKTKKCWKCGCTQFTSFPPPDEKYCQYCWTDSNENCSGEHKSYLGNNDQEKDIEYRCTLLKKSIETAFNDANLIKAKVRRQSWNLFSKKEPVLKVFMVPEFYFRGTEGAYPFEQIHTIMEIMREETDSDAYKDWLFIFGTAIGYLKQEETIVKITSVERIPGNKTKITVDSLLESDWISAQASDYLQFKDCSDASKAPITGPVAVTSHTRGIQATIKGIQHEKDNLFKITLDTDLPCPAGNHIFFYRTDISQTKRFEIKACGKDPEDSTIITIENPDQHIHQSCPECPENNKCGTFEPLPSKPYLCRICLHTHSSNSSNYIRKNQYAKMESVLELKTNAGFDVTHFIKLIAKEAKTEIGNYALVTKGGAKHEDTDEPEQFVIFKEYISSIDFLREQKKNWGKKADRRIDIHGQKDRIVLPTEGSRDLLSAKNNIPGTTTTYIDKDGNKKEHRISEINKVGYGGGSVFTIDDITFGLEICLDHAYDRIWNFYDGQAKIGDPKVQIHLIPSWGMSIGGGKVACVKNGLVYNVDGARSDSVARVYDGKWSCDDHPDEIKNKTGDCSICNEPLKKTGSPIKVKNTKTVTNSRIKNYYEDDGKIVVYNPVKIPFE